MLVDIYIKARWKGSLRGSGKAAAVIVCTDRLGEEHYRVTVTEVKDSTKERLQLQAVTKALHELKKPCQVGIYINNELIKRAIASGWPQRWSENGWKNSKGKEIKNADVWKILLPLLKEHDIGIMGYIARYEPLMAETLGE